MTEIKQTQFGSGDNVAGDKIINNAFYKSVDYKELTERIAELREDLRETENPERKFIKLQKLNETETQLEKFKQDVTRLYETFTKIEINTERLRLAKEYFENGKIREADAILKTEDLVEDQTKLLGELQRDEDKIQATKEKLKNNANEFLIKAQTTAAIFTQSDWFDKTTDFYKKSIQSFEGLNNLFGFANFLLRNKVREAGEYFEKSLSYAIDPEDRMTVYNNLGYFYSDIKETKKAETAYIEALQITRQLTANNKEAWEPFLASVLNNLGAVYIETDLEKAELFFNEAFEIRKRLFEKDSIKYEDDFTRILNNYGRLYIGKSDFDNAEKYMSDALKIQEQFAETNRDFYDPQIARSYINLSVIYMLKKEYNKGIDFALKSVVIQERLAQINPSENLQESVDLYQKMALYYARYIIDPHEEEKWNEKALEGLKLLGQFNPQLKMPLLAQFQNYLATRYAEKNNPQKAEQLFLDEIETFKYLAKLYPAAFTPDISLKLIKMSNFYYSVNDIEKEKQVLLEALPIAKKLAELNQDEYDTDLATIYQNLGVIHTKKLEYNEAKEYYEETLNIYKKLAGQDPVKYKSNIAQIMLNLADVYHFQNDNQNTLHVLDELIPLLSELSIKDPAVYFPKLGTAYHNLGIACTNAFNFDKAEKAYKDALFIRTALFKMDASSFSNDLLDTQRNLQILTFMRESFNKITAKKTDVTE